MFSASSMGPCVLRMRDGGCGLEKSGVVEVLSSLERGGRPVFRDLRWGVRYAAMYKPYHLIGLG
jgi:hypothetical protein